jgi:hypothetical protein
MPPSSSARRPTVQYMKRLKRISSTLIRSEPRGLSRLRRRCRPPLAAYAASL